MAAKKKTKQPDYEVREEFVAGASYAEALKNVSYDRGAECVDMDTQPRRETRDGVLGFVIGIRRYRRNIVLGPGQRTPKR